MMKFLVRTIFIALLIGGLSGCYRATVLTEVQKDGSWTRTATFISTSNNNGDKKETVDAQLAPFFDLPKGQGWQISRATTNPTGGEKSEKYIAVRNLRSGETLDHDVVVKDTNSKAPMLVNSVRVREVAPGQIEYVEFYRWKGEKLEKDNNFNVGIKIEDVLKILEQLVPADFLTPERREALAKNARFHMWLLLWGPGDPLANDFLQSAFSPEGVKYKLSRRILEAWQQILDQTFGEAMPREKKRIAIKVITRDEIAALEKDGFAKANDKGPRNSVEETPVPITVRLRMPGTIIETNGEQDPLYDEIYWTFYAPAARAKDIVLRAVCKVGK